MKGLLLAIDQGTSGTKTVLFDDKGKLLAKASAPLNSLYPKPGFVEQDPLEIYQTVLDSVKGCLENAKTTDAEIIGKIGCIGISNQRETFVLWDKDGKPLHNAVVWQCKRAVAICEELAATPLKDEVTARTGLIIDPYFSGTKLKWLIDNDSALKAKLDKGEVYFGNIDTWLLYKLTSGKSYFTDYTNASRTLMFNLHSLQWDSYLVEQLGAENINLPETVPSSHRFGETTFDGLLDFPLPITGMIGDSHAASFGEGCFSPGEAKVTLGTGSSILCSIGDKVAPSRHGMVNTINWSSIDRTDYALEGIIVTCGATIKWLRDQLQLIDTAAETKALAESVEDNGGVYLIPAFSGLGAPHWKMDAKGSIVGLTFGSTKAHVVRAALESVAFQIKDVIEAMVKDSGFNLSEIKVDGGMTSNSWLMQYLADLLQVKVTSIGIEEVSALGAANIAGLQHGIFPRVEETLSSHPESKTYFPAAAPASCLAAYAGWKEMVKKHC